MSEDDGWITIHANGRDYRVYTGADDAQFVTMSKIDEIQPTNYDKLMAEMTVEKLAELFVRSESHQDYPDDMPVDRYYTEHAGIHLFYEDAIKAEIDWLNKLYEEESDND